MQEKDGAGLNGLGEALLREAVANPGIATVDLIKPFLKSHSKSTIRRRLRLLEDLGFIKRDTRYTRKVLINPTSEGKEFAKIVGERRPIQED